MILLEVVNFLMSGYFEKISTVMHVHCISIWLRYCSARMVYSQSVIISVSLCRLRFLKATRIYCLRTWTPLLILSIILLLVGNQLKDWPNIKMSRFWPQRLACNWGWWLHWKWRKLWGSHQSRRAWSSWGTQWNCWCGVWVRWGIWKERPCRSWCKQG